MSILLDINRKLADYPNYADDNPFYRDLVSALGDRDADLLFEENEIYESFFPVLYELDIPRDEWLDLLEPVIVKAMALKYPDERRYLGVC